jgi:hypothetical protein
LVVKSHQMLGTAATIMKMLVKDQIITEYFKLFYLRV